MNVAVTARTAGKVTLSVVGDRLIATHDRDVQAGTAKIPLTVGRDWGRGAYVVATLRRPLDEAQAHAGPRDRPAVVLGRQAARTLASDAAAEA